MHVDEEHGLPAQDPLAGDRPRRQPRRLGRAAAADRPHPPAARPHGGDRPSDRRRRQIWRAGRVPDRRDQPQAAPPRAAACGSTRPTAARSTSPPSCRRISPRAWRRSGFDPMAGDMPAARPARSGRRPEAKQRKRRGRGQGAAPRARAGERRARGVARPEGEAAVNRLAIFDCDGTLVDSGATIHARARATLRRSTASTCPPPSVSRQVIGLSLTEAMAALLPDADRASRALAEDYKRRLHGAARRGRRSRSRCSTASLELLDALEADGWLLGVATGKSRPRPRALPRAATASTLASSRCRPPTGTRPSRIRRWRCRRWPSRRRAGDDDRHRRHQLRHGDGARRPARRRSAPAGAITTPTNCRRRARVAVAEQPLDVLDADREHAAWMTMTRGGSGCSLYHAGAARRAGDLLPRHRDRLHRPGPARRLAAARRDRRDHRRDRRGVRAAAAQASVGRAGPRAVKRFWKDVGGRAGRRGLGDRARRPAGADAGARAAGRADRRRWPRRSPTNGATCGEDDRPARDAADRPRQCRDRPGRAGPAALRGGLARYAEADLACYRAEGPTALVERQAESWDPLLAWARRRYDVDFAIDTGIIHVPQPPATVERLAPCGRRARSVPARRPVAAGDDRRLAGRRAGGAREARSTPEQAWEAVSLDERWQLEQWGADAEAEAALDNRRRDFLAAARFLELLELVRRADQVADESRRRPAWRARLAARRRRSPGLRPGMRPCRR